MFLQSIISMLNILGHSNRKQTFSHCVIKIFLFVNPVISSDGYYYYYFFFFLRHVCNSERKTAAKHEISANISLGTSVHIFCLYVCVCVCICVCVCVWALFTTKSTSQQNKMRLLIFFTVILFFCVFLFSIELLI